MLPDRRAWTTPNLHELDIMLDTAFEGGSDVDGSTGSLLVD